MAEHTDSDRVRLWLNLNATDDPDLVAAVVEAANSVTARYVGEVSAETIPSESDASLAATMLAARLYRRRNSPEGVQGVTPDGLAIGIVRSDPDIARLLRIDQFSTPQVG